MTVWGDLRSREESTHDPAVAIRHVLQIGRERGASDIHIDPHEGVALRICAQVERLRDAVVSREAIEAFVCATFTPLARAKLERIGVADAALGDPEGGLRIHVSRTNRGLRLAIRLLPEVLPDTDTLMLPEAVVALSAARSGLVVVAAPQGNGKTATIMSLLAKQCASSARHLITIESSTEFILRWERSIVSQYEVGRDVATFADGVRGAMRADADVIFVGEIPDLETLRACLDAAEAGLLVLAALAASPEVPQVLARLVAMFPVEERERARRRLGDALRALVGLRLLPSRDAVSMRAATEVLIANEAARRLIREGALHQVRAQLSRDTREGSQTLESSLCRLVAEGAVDLGVARAASQYPGEIVAPADRARSVSGLP